MTAHLLGPDMAACSLASDLGDLVSRYQSAMYAAAVAERLDQPERAERHREDARAVLVKWPTVLAELEEPWRLPAYGTRRQSRWPTAQVYATLAVGQRLDGLLERVTRLEGEVVRLLGRDQRATTRKRVMSNTTVNYELSRAVIDGPAFDEGAKVKLTVWATVEEIYPEPVGLHGDRIERRLIVEDWAGPVADDADVCDMATEYARLRLGFAALAAFAREEMPEGMTLAEIVTTGAAAFSETVDPEQIEALREIEAEMEAAGP